MPSFWAPREVVGPNCTAEQAMALWSAMLDGSAWPNRKDADREPIMSSYTKRFAQFPFSCCERAVERIVREEKFFPPWATIQETIEAEWRIAGKSWKPTKADEGTSNESV